MSFLLKLVKPIQALDSWIDENLVKLKSKFFILSGGYTCSICGARHIHFTSPDVEGKVFHKSGLTKKMILNWWLKDRAVICPDCVLTRIGRAFSGPITTSSDGLHLGTCQFTGQENIPVIGIIWGVDYTGFTGFNLRFGGTWWNGHTASYEAFEHAVKSCVMKTSNIKMVGEKMLYMQNDMLLEPQSYGDWKAKQ